MTLQASPSSQALLAAAGRILLAAIFLYSGIGKALTPEATMGYIEYSGLPFASFGLVLAVAIEVGGGAMLALGIKTRLAALGLALFALFTALAFHHDIGERAHLVLLLRNFAIAGGLLQVIAFGAGAYSLDALSGRKRVAQTA